MKALLSLGIEIGVSLIASTLLLGVVSHTGKLVSAENRALTMIYDEDGSTHTFEVASDAPVFRNSRKVTLEDLVPGDAVRVTTDASQTVTSVDATSPSSEFGSLSYP